MSTLTGQCLANRFALNGQFLGALLEGFEANGYRESFSGARPALWQLGHIAASRFGVARLMGVDLPRPAWAEHFTRQSDGIPTDAWPTPKEILAPFGIAGDAICQALNEADEDFLAAPMEFVLGGQQVPRADNVSFLEFHETYHIGQIGLIRSMLGLPYIA